MQKMQILKYFIFISIILSGLLFLFGPEVIPENFQLQEVLNKVKNKDVIIVFNSGGWGDTPLEKAEDFAPVIEEIQKTLQGFGYNSIVIPFNRTKNTLTGKFSGAKDFLRYFESSSDILARDLEFLAEKFPNKKIIITGLSAGGALANETIERMSDKARNSVYAIAAGTPFWIKTPKSENVLQLDNNGKDSLVEGNTKSLLLALIKAPFQWVSSKIKGENITLSQAFYAPGHDYSWSSPEVGSRIVNFLENKIH